MFRKSFAEFLSTFCLVFAGTGAIVADARFGGAVGHVGISLTFGLVVLAMIYAVGDVSGAHMNPAVTIGFWASGKFPASHVPGFVVAQLLGAVAASGLLRLLVDGPGKVAGTMGQTVPAESLGWLQTIGFEIALTAILMWVILHVATGAKEKGLLAGVAIGSTVALEAMFAGPFTGASMNPARSFGPAIVGRDLEWLPAYFIGPLIGALIAVPLHRYLDGPDSPSF